MITKIATSNFARKIGGNLRVPFASVETKLAKDNIFCFEGWCASSSSSSLPLFGFLAWNDLHAVTLPTQNDRPRTLRG